MKRIAFAILLTIVAFATARAAEVDEATTRRVAVAFWNAHHPADVKDVDEASLTLNVFEDLSLVRVYSVADNGFVIVSADNSALPVLGYSFDSPFPKELHPSLRYWLNGYQSQLAELDAEGVEASQQVAGAWNTLLTSVAGRKDSAQDSVTPVAALLKTRWDQGNPYNKYCPYDSIGHIKTVVGCVATAMAQVIRYWEHPTCGTGSHSYVPVQRTQTAFDTLTADFAHTTYIYEYMPNVLYDGISRAREVDAVAKLSYHCGIAVNMMYGSSSGAYSSCGYYDNGGNWRVWTNACAVSAFTDFFKYDATLINYAERDHVQSDSVWLALIDNDIYAGRPIYYSGHDSTGGHAFVLDGIDVEHRYHFNWGWGGSGDGFYIHTNIAPGSGGYGGNATYSFNYGQAAIFNLQPVPTQLDTVDIYDTVCYDAGTYTFYEHTVTVANKVYNLVHLDTIYRLHLSKSQRRYAYFNANGGVGGEISKHFCHLKGLVLPRCTFTREQHRFVGWSPSHDGSDTIYQVGDTLDITDNIVLYAIWEEVQGITSPVAESLALWPNPTTGEVSLTLPDSRKATVSVLDALGRTVLFVATTDDNAGTVKFSIHNLPAGTYTVRVATTEGVYNQQIIKQ